MIACDQIMTSLRKNRFSYKKSAIGMFDANGLMDKTKLLECSPEESGGYFADIGFARPGNPQGNGE